MPTDPEAVISDLKENGYAVQEDVLTEEECDELGDALDELENSQEWEDWIIDHRERQKTVLNAHYAKPDTFLEYISVPEILDVVGGVLDDPFLLSNFNGSRAAQNDVDGYRMHIDSRRPISNFNGTYQIVANVCVDDFSAENGSTVVVPKSHETGRDPRNVDVEEKHLVAPEAPKGSVIYTLGQTWHDIGNNRSGDRRWGIIAYYCSWWVKPTYNFVDSCSEEIFDQLDETQKSLLGFSTRPPADWRKRTKTVCNVEDIPDSLDEARNWDGT